MKSIYLLVFASCNILLFSCKKENNSDTKPDCETNNYAIMKVSFGASNVKHGVLLTFNATGSRDKIIAAGVTSDTLRVAPGNYTIEVSSLNNANQSINSQVFQRTVTQCNETALSVAF